MSGRRRSELGLQRFAEGDRLGGDDVHQRAALHAGEDGRVDLLLPVLLAQDETAARAAQRLVRRRGDEVGERHRADVLARGHQPRDVGHVHHEQCADFAGKSA